MKRFLGIGALLACVLIASAAAGEKIVTGKLILTVDGGYAPRALPRRAFAPIDFKGHFDVQAPDGGVPPSLQQLVVDFDRDGRLYTRGLPTCDPELLRASTPEEARAICGRAIVGRGHLEAMLEREGQPPTKVASLLTLFNGPREEGHPTAILQARISEPFTEVFDVTIPIKKRRGNYRYRATIGLPAIAAGRGAITHVDIDIGRRWRFAGKPRSYVSARCSDDILSTHGRFTFTNTVVDGSIDKGCTTRRR
jgi:hypothetical protein